MAKRRDRSRTEEGKERIELPGLVVWDDASWLRRSLRRLGRLIGIGRRSKTRASGRGRRRRSTDASDAGVSPAVELEAPDVGGGRESVSSDPEDGRRPDPAEAGPATPSPPARTAERDTLQMLPGRLRPIDPSAVRQEIRLLRTPSAKQVVTIGWDPGDPPDHVTLDHPSVRGRHARMHYEEGRWSIESLVEADPVHVNGVPVPVSASPRALEGGDRVRIGKAEFDFILP